MSYDDEQLQQFLIQESEKQKILMDREFKEQQEKEYQDSLNEDLIKLEKEIRSKLDEEQHKFDEPSKEEMRRVRIARFSIKE